LIVTYLQSEGKVKGPMMLIVAPTRELAMQSQEVLEEAGQSCNIRRKGHRQLANIFLKPVMHGYGS
jgi:superfamily II DNA/RNA helicase